MTPHTSVSSSTAARHGHGIGVRIVVHVVAGRKLEIGSTRAHHPAKFLV